MANSVVDEKAVKRKVAIGRFSNETRYGRTFVTDANLDPLGKQASDILASRLAASKQFLVFERPDIAVAAEQSLSRDAGLIGVDALILGSVTEFGRSTTGKSGFLSGTKVQHAHAKVELRLVDVKTGYVFFSASGTGEASTESGEIAGFGSSADYDGSLNDKAISAAISDVIGRMMTKLKERPWKSDILKADGSTVYISGGALQGIKPGANLHVYKAGESIQSGQTLRRPSRFNRSAEGTNTPDLICCTSESDDWSGFAVSLSPSRGRVDGRNLACSSHSNGRVTVAANVNFATV